MDLKKFHGVVPAMATPFTAEERFDERRARELIEWYLASGVHGISVAGSQGEFFALERDEHLRLLEVAVKTVNGRVPLYAGTGAVTTREAIRLTQAAEAMGADLALVITPYFAQPTQDELVAHYTAIARATKLPVMLYNNPPRTAVNVLPPTLVRCMQAADNVVGIKDSSGDLELTVEYIRVAPPEFSVLMGRDTLIYAGLLYGTRGGIAATGNVKPGLVAEIYDKFMAGDLKGALAAQRALAPLRLAFTWGSFPVVIKEALDLMGMEGGHRRNQRLLPLAY